MSSRINPENKRVKRKSNQSKKHSKKKKRGITRVVSFIKKDPIKVMSVVFGGLLLIIITILFILFARNNEMKKSETQRIKINSLR